MHMQAGSRSQYAVTRFTESHKVKLENSTSHAGRDEAPATQGLYMMPMPLADDNG